MTQLQRYLAEEIAEDHADGILTRRDAVKRLGLLGLSASAASALLARFATEAPAAPVTKRRHPRGTVMTEWAPVATEAIEFAGRNGTLKAAWAPAARPRGGLLVIHENRGLTDHIENVAGRYAASGYSALALDLLSEEGGTDNVLDDGRRQQILSSVDPTRFDTDMQDAVSELRRRLPRKRLGVIGFCFGGMMVWRLLVSGEKRLSAAAPYYGPFSEGGDLRRAKAAVFAVYGGLDTRVLATRDAAIAALVAARLPHEIATFTEANHAFFNDTGQNFNLPASQAAYGRTVAWYDKYLAEH